MFTDRETQSCQDVRFPNLLYRFYTVPIKIPASYFVDIDKLILNFIRKCKEPRIDETILKKKNKVGDLMLRNFKIYYKITIIKTVWF